VTAAAQSRRDMLRTVAGFALASSLPVAAAASMMEADLWAKITRDVSRLHANAPAAVERARRSGLDPEDFSAAYVGRPSPEFPGGGPHLQFGEWWRPGAFWVSVSPAGITAWEGRVRSMVA
jgi:hypothetical protein